MSKSRAHNILESYDDIITGLMGQMDTYARQSGGYINRMHPDQFNQDGTKKELISERKRENGKRIPRSRSR